MTNNEPRTPTDRLAATLIDAMNSDDFDILDALAALHDLLPPPTFSDLTLQLEFCPIHLCDAQICIDDETHDPYA
jgi:hypothetical protein